MLGYFDCKPLFAKENYIIDLDKSVKIGLKLNKNLQYTDAEIRLQIEAISQQSRQFFPHLSFSVGDNSTVAFGSQDSKSKVVSVNVSQLLYDGNKLQNQIKNSEISMMLSILETEQKKIEYIYSVIDQYLSLLTLFERIELKNMLYKNQMSEYQITKKRYELGEATALDLYEWEIQIQENKLSLMENTNDLNNKTLDFKKLIGLTKEDILTFSEKLKFGVKISSTNFNKDQVINNALQTSLDLKKIEFSIQQAQISSVAKQQLLPDIYLNASYSTPLDHLFREKDTWNLGLSVTLPFFFDKITLQGSLGGDLNGLQKNMSKSVNSTVYENPGYFQSLASENLSYDKLNYTYNETRNGIEIETLKLIEEIRFQKEKIDILDNKIKMSEEKNIILQKQLNLGELKLSEYINFQNTLHSSKLDRLETIHSYMSLLVKLYKLQGKLSESDIQQMFKGFLIPVN
jgi:outer membrane protein TolC